MLWNCFHDINEQSFFEWDSILDASVGMCKYITVLSTKENANIPTYLIDQLLFKNCSVGFGPTYDYDSTHELIIPGMLF